MSLDSRNPCRHRRTCNKNFHSSSTTGCGELISIVLMAGNIQSGVAFKSRCKGFALYEHICFPWKKIHCTFIPSNSYKLWKEGYWFCSNLLSYLPNCMAKKAIYILFLLQKTEKYNCYMNLSVCSPSSKLKREKMKVLWEHSFSGFSHIHISWLCV